MPLQLPFTPGIEVSGTIEEVGSGVTGLKKGRAVFGSAQGGYAEYAIAQAAAVVAKPDGLSFEIAATLPLGALTAWQSLEDAGSKPGKPSSSRELPAAWGFSLFNWPIKRVPG